MDRINLAHPTQIYYAQHKRGHGNGLFFSADTTGQVLCRRNLSVGSWFTTDVVAKDEEPLDAVAHRVFSWVIGGLLRGQEEGGSSLAQQGKHTTAKTSH